MATAWKFIQKSAKEQHWNIVQNCLNSEDSRLQQRPIWDCFQSQSENVGNFVGLNVVFETYFVTFAGANLLLFRNKDREKCLWNKSYFTLFSAFCSVYNQLLSFVYLAGHHNFQIRQGWEKRPKISLSIPSELTSKCQRCQPLPHNPEFYTRSFSTA